MNQRQDLVSADAHMNEPPSLWLERLPDKYKDHGPCIVMRKSGERWHVEGFDTCATPEIKRKITHDNFLRIFNLADPAHCGVASK